MATGTIKANQTTGTATRKTGSSGSLAWIRQGDVVTVTGSIQITSNASHGTTLFSGLPTPRNDYVPIPVHNSTTGYHFSSYLLSSGDLKNSEQWSGSAYYQISGSYIV